ncbi:MAG: membrane protein insertase YidC [Dehalococcoidia bacterium]|nr:membrane protein insertase YidC [Dehalococcoidia bacterium]
MGIGFFFDTVLINPLTNLFVLLTAVTGSTGAAVILLTIIIRIVTLPLTLKQMHSTRMMAVLAPRMQDIQKRFKDPRRRQEETMRLYKDAGINPLGCFSSMLLQFPILFALYRTFTLTVGEAPEALIRLNERIYPWGLLQSAVPLPGEFLWLHLGRPDPIILPVLVAATTFILQKMTMMPAMDERQRAQNSMMNMLMPLIFGWITISLPSGLGLYYVLSNVIGMVLQYAYVGGGAFNWKGLIGLSQDPVLPRALEVRQRQMDSVEEYTRGQEPVGTAALEETGSGNGANAGRRRRRYANGRRRGRR